MTPTQRTIRELKNLGRICGIVERFISNAHIPSGIRSDLFGIIDIIALDPERGVIGIQTCGNSFSEHWKKITEERYQETHDWLSTPGARLELWAWRKVKLKRGGVAMRWQPRVVEITLNDLIADNRQ